MKPNTVREIASTPGADGESNYFCFPSQSASKAQAAAAAAAATTRAIVLFVKNFPHNHLRGVVLLENHHTRAGQKVIILKWAGLQVTSADRQTQPFLQHPLTLGVDIALRQKSKGKGNK